MTMTHSTPYHIPVLLHPSVDGMISRPDGVYVDVTFGGGGHSNYILSKITDGCLVAFDQDDAAQANLPQDDRLIFIPQNFEYLKNNLRLMGKIPVTGILADLGVSSHQFDTADRGFSFRFDAKLDMRMNRSLPLSAAQVIANYGEEDLIRIFKTYGELTQAKKIANLIAQHRKQKNIDTVHQLCDILNGLAPQAKMHSFLAKVFQALRIEVNQEMKVLERFLLQCSEVMEEGGMLSVITYHSLEDRMVKNFMKTGNVDGIVEKDFFGNLKRPFEPVNRKPIVPDEQEIKLNNRSRSAKLRLAKRIFS